MRRILIALVGAWLCSALPSATRAAEAFPNPPGGWTYVYQGDQLTVGEPGSGWTSLDGTWTHDNGSDEWDGTEIGGTLVAGGGSFGSNSPGGTSLGTQNGVSYLRLQDTGDPRDYGYADPSSRKVYFGHNVADDIDAGKAATLLDTGLTLTFRARIPTLAKAGPPLDRLHRDGQQGAGPQPYPDNGDGYVTSDGGKGNFVIRQGGNGAEVSPGAIAFSFTQVTDTTGGDPNAGRAGFAGLTFNEFNGNVPTANVNFGQGTKTNVVAFDPTDWHELYIVIRKDPGNIGTHEAFIFLDGNLTPSVFKMTAGTGADMNDTFLAMGGSATPQNWALDVDWFGYKDEAVFPPGAKLPPSISDVVPAFNATFHPAASGLAFQATSRMPGNTLPAAGVKLSLNGQDLSSQLTLTGTDSSSSRSGSYQGLQPNSVYAGALIVTDSGGLSSTNDLAFDTFVASQTVVIEAEDYNYGGGQFIDNPDPGAFSGQVGTAGVDFLDSTSGDASTYRGDAVDTATSTDVARERFVSAGQPDYQVQNLTDGEWVNYTRTVPAGSFLAYLRVASTAARDVRLERVGGSAGQANPPLEFLGAFRVPRTGTLNSYAYVPLTDVQGRPINLPLGGRTTLRLTAVGANNDLNVNYLVLAPAGAPSADPTVSVQPSPAAAGVLPESTVEAAIYDGAAAVDRASVKLRINGVEVPAAIARTGTLTTVKHAPAALWPPATLHSVNLTFNDGTARSVDWSFTTANYPVLTPAMKVTDARTPGFVWRMFQNEANQDTSVAKVEDALAGRLRDGSGQPLPNLADPLVAGPATGPGTPASPGTGTVTFRIPTVINVSQTEGTSFGSFTPEEQMPGIPGTSGSTDGIAVEIRTFLELPRGFITMIVNSDDGFQTSAGFLGDAPLVLGELNGGRSAADTVFQFAVEEAGTYAFRTLYFEGGGDASLEWLLLKPDGQRVLLNDTANGGPRAFQDGTVPAKPAGNVTVTIRPSAGGNVTLEWTAGTLEAADAISGPFAPVANAASPFTTSASEAQKFYRIKVL